MMRVLWFGTRGFERWVKMPRIDLERGLYGWSSRSDHVNGGVTTKRSPGGHMEYGMEWNAITSEGAASIRNILDGLYNTTANRGLIHFLDPSAQRVNAFNKVWAQPSLAAAEFGGPSLTKGVRPTVGATGSNSFQLPPQTATFTVAEGTVMNTFYTPIPPGHTARFAFYGPTAQTDKIAVAEYTGETPGTPTEIDIVANADYGTGLLTSTANGVEFSLSADVGSVALTTAILQITPTGETLPAAATYLSGRGHSGCKVDGKISQVLSRVDPRNPSRNRETLAVRLVEEGSWL